MSNAIKRNVLFYRDRLLPLSETFIKEQAESLCRFTPYYLGARPSPGIALPPQLTTFIGRQGPIGRLQEVLFKGLHVAPFALRKIKVLCPVLVHAHFAQDGVEAMPISESLNVPLVVTLHGYDVTMRDEVFSLHRRGRRYLRLRRRLGETGSRFIAVSEFIAGKVREAGFPQDKIRVHYIGVNVDRFRPDATIVRESLVLFVGRLVEKKGCEYAIRAVASLQREIKGLRLAIIGDGPLRRHLEELARSESCDCLFLGAQSPEVVRQWMNQARVCCVPSITAEDGNAEGLPTVVQEAQAMGLPVVGSASAGIPEAVEHGVTGLLAPERDWVILAMHLKTLFTEDATWRKFSIAARERVCQRFDLKIQTALLENLYDEVIQEQLCREHRRIEQ
jgi:colanic acid/amylovoran biosynthesis glycosyltransferase